MGPNESYCVPHRSKQLTECVKVKRNVCKIGKIKTILNKTDKQQTFRIKVVVWNENKSLLTFCNSFCLV